MKERHRKHFILNRMKHGIKFFWKWNGRQRQMHFNSIVEIFKKHDEFQKKIEGSK